MNGFTTCETTRTYNPPPFKGVTPGVFIVSVIIHALLLALFILPPLGSSVPVKTVVSPVPIDRSAAAVQMVDFSLYDEAVAEQVRLFDHARILQGENALLRNAVQDLTEDHRYVAERHESMLRYLLDRGPSEFHREK